MARGKIEGVETLLSC